MIVLKLSPRNRKTMKKQSKHDMFYKLKESKQFIPQMWILFPEENSARRDGGPLSSSAARAVFERMKEGH